MRILFAFLIVLVLSPGLGGCAGFQSNNHARPARNTASQPQDTKLKSAESAYDTCIKKRTDTMTLTTGNAEKLSSAITAGCTGELNKISAAFGQTMANNVKNADPVATGKFYATAYESKTRKALVRTILEKRS